ncbi:hypothetical protein K491DRAFT_107273 [Lophiostoma macrostomum CBS 122681]|uniref:Uncharacterized protein n=1 Tax=Lophiostoma macrostomum CBS 122681 TaxID=1314788 RepID=A0A6A6TJ24_9PLEO|nr:hypothetical protein K491DRAFT_107273 [Lophiostoma macrostomum CBS 122681]
MPWRRISSLEGVWRLRQVTTVMCSLNVRRGSLIASPRQFNWRSGALSDCWGAAVVWLCSTSTRHRPGSIANSPRHVLDLSHELAFVAHFLVPSKLVLFRARSKASGVARVAVEQGRAARHHHAFFKSTSPLWVSI